MLSVGLSNSISLLSDASLDFIFARELIDLLVSPTSKVLNGWFEVITDFIYLDLKSKVSLVCELKCLCFLY